MKTNSSHLLRMTALCLGVIISVNATSVLRAAPPNASSKSAQPAASVDTGARTPAFSRMVDDLKARATSLTKWLALRSALKSIGYSKDEMARIKDALRHNSVSLNDADFFCARWHRQHHEVINPRQLLTVLKQLLEAESPQLAGLE